MIRRFDFERLWRAQLNPLIKDLSLACDDDSLRKIIKFGFRYNEVSDQVYEQIFTIDSDRSYIESQATVLSAKTTIENLSPEPLRNSIRALCNALADYGRELVGDSYQPVFFFTESRVSNRVRIPVHVHRNSAITDTGHEMTLSFAVRIRRNSQRARFLFFQPTQNENPDRRVYEELLGQSPKEVIVLHEDTHIFWFSGRQLPHCLEFGNDLLLWAVFNGCGEIRFNDRLKDQIGNQLNEAQG